MSADPFPNELEDAAAKALAMDESSLVFTDGYGGFDFDHGGAARTVLSVVGPLIQQARDADGQRLYSLLALFDTRDGSPLADLVQHAREGWERSHPDMGEDDAWQAFDSLWSRFTDRERSDLGDDRAREKAEQVIRGSMACGVAAERAVLDAVERRTREIVEALRANARFMDDPFYDAADFIERHFLSSPEREEK